MKKTLKILSSLIGCAFVLCGCKDNVVNNDIPAGVVPIDQIKVEDDIPPVEIVKKTCKEVSLGQSGLSLTDFAVGSYIEPSCTYNCSFSHSKTFSGEYTVKSDDRTIAQVQHEAGTNTFTVKGITPGDAIIEAKTDEGEVVLRFVAHVRERIPMNKIASTLYKTPLFYGMYNDYKLSFISENPIAGVLSGHDDFENTTLNFKLTSGVEERIQNGTDFNTYKFKISVDTDNSVTSRTYTDLYISTTGDKIYMYYTNGIVDIFSNEYVNIYANKEEKIL